MCRSSKTRCWSCSATCFENALTAVLCLSQVRISLHRTAAGIDVCVEDDGPGVPADQRARILQRGERLDRQHPGQGIGLAVVKDIIESYDAQLTLDDSSLGGAAFRIRFPLT